MTNTINFATKGVIFKEDKVLLVVKSDSEEINPNTVDIPGGRLEFGEMPEDGLKREIMEETALEADVIKPTRCWSFVKEEKGFQLVGVTFLCEYKSGEVKLSDEHDKVLWIDPEEVLNGDYPSWLKKEIKEALKIRKWLTKD